MRRCGSWSNGGRWFRTLPMADKALEPVFPRYAYLQNVDAETLGRELDGMSRLGCGSIFIDDGWQQYGSGRG